ncbi:MAG: pyroglutamyl-peptidase I [Salinigranum sp.]
MSTILLTGFEPFGEHETNPAVAVTERLDGASFGGVPVVGHELPVVFDEALPTLRKHVEEFDPVAIVSLGLMPGRRALTVERVGINVRDYDGVPDNDGAEPVDDPIVADGPAAYFATLPIRDLVAASRDAGVPARVSNTAGTHLCNNILYQTRHYVATDGSRVDAGFVHVPLSHQQAARREETVPSMSLDAMTSGVRAMLAELATRYR